jgi:chaperonin cofactor prefoldin
LKENPASVVYRKQVEELAALREENKRLLEYQQQGSITSTAGDVPLSLTSTNTVTRLNKEKEALEKRVTDLELRMQRLKEICSKKIMEFRETCSILIGWKIEMLEDAALHHGDPILKYRISSVYAEDDTGYLLFQITGKTVELLPTEFSSSIPPTIYKWISQHHSIPSFLAEITTSLADRYFTSRSIKATS